MSNVRRGLSLIEVLIVAVLIAVLMALSLPMLSSANARARSELCQQNLTEIGQTIAVYTQEMKRLPVLDPQAPDGQGLTLPEFIEPQLHTPHVLFCPCDETEESQRLGTSYTWSSRLNGLGQDDLYRLFDQTLLQDREPFHTGSNPPINELKLQ